MKKFTLVIFSVTFLWLPCNAQEQGDTVAIGDTALVLSYSAGCSLGVLDCTCEGIDGGVYPEPGTEFFDEVPTTNFSNGGVMNIYFAPIHEGIQRDTAYVQPLCGPNYNCASPIYRPTFWGFGVSDSFPKIRPQGWSITMTPDSFNRVWMNHSTPTFDNPISDTTIFSEFSARTPKGDNVMLHLYDSSAIITQYVALPFVRKRPLNLFFSSQNYLSFDTVIISTRIQHQGVDSIISYALTVTWEAPLSVGQSNDNDIGYAMPNPFSTQLAIGFTLNKAENVKLQLFDLTGRELRNEEQEFPAGLQSIMFDVGDLPPGSYFYVLHGSEWNRSGNVVKIEP